MSCGTILNAKYTDTWDNVLEGKKKECMEKVFKK